MHYLVVQYNTFNGYRSCLMTCRLFVLISSRWSLVLPVNVFRIVNGTLSSFQQSLIWSLGGWIKPDIFIPTRCNIMSVWVRLYHFHYQILYNWASIQCITILFTSDIRTIYHCALTNSCASFQCRKNELMKKFVFEKSFQYSLTYCTLSYFHIQVTGMQCNAVEIALGKSSVNGKTPPTYVMISLIIWDRAQSCEMEIGSWFLYWSNPLVITPQSWCKGLSLWAISQLRKVHKCVTQ